MPIRRVRAKISPPYNCALCGTRIAAAEEMRTPQGVDRREGHWIAQMPGGSWVHWLCARFALGETGRQPTMDDLYNDRKGGGW